MNNPRRPVEAREGGIRALNDANDASRLDQLLHQYFRIASPAVGAARKRQRSAPRQQSRRSRAALLPDNEEVVSPEGCMKQIKQFLKHSSQPAHLNRVADTIIIQLKKAKRNRELLGLVVTLCQELFTRSAAFRALVAGQAASFFEKLLHATGETHVFAKRRARDSAELGDNPHGPELALVLALIESWKDDFGGRYPTIAAGHSVLVERGYLFPQVKQRAREMQEATSAQVLQQDRVREAKCQQMAREMDRVVPEIEATIDEMNGIFEILVPTLDAFNLVDDQDTTSTDVGAGGNGESGGADGTMWEDVPSNTLVSAAVPKTYSVPDDADGDDGDDGIDWEDVGDADDADQDDGDESETSDEGANLSQMDMNEIVQAYGLGSSSYQLTITIPTDMCEKSAENEVLFRNLADGVLQIRKRFLPLVIDWTEVADAAGSAPVQVDVRQRLHGLRSRLEQATLKWEDLVKESERKRFAHIRPRVVSLPLAAYDGPEGKSRGKRPRNEGAATSSSRSRRLLR